MARMCYSHDLILYDFCRFFGNRIVGYRGERAYLRGFGLLSLRRRFLIKNDDPA